MTLTAAYFQKHLLQWFDQHGRKNLPWQINKTPYRVWVSEIMLQQTQVSTVIPYFEKFMHTFPSLQDLAAASSDQVMHLWAGLGYYSRARCLHRAAQMVMDEYHGVFPSTLDDLKALPGIGPSTAGAILSIAYGQRATILDGNVKRVLARVQAITTPVNDKATEETLWQLAVRYTPASRNADYTQAIMDLGATLCTRSRPNCTSCPLQRKCQAYAKEIVSSIPAKKVSKKIPTREATFLILKHGERVLLLKRPGYGIWGGLFSLPEIKGADLSLEAIKAYCREQWQCRVSRVEKLDAFRHTFSHYHLQLHPLLLEVKKISNQVMEGGQQIWYNLSKPENVGLPKPIQSILRELT